jgi:hypothetical protein
VVFRSGFAGHAPSDSFNIGLDLLLQFLSGGEGTEGADFSQQVNRE